MRHKVVDRVDELCVHGSDGGAVHGPGPHHEVVRVGLAIRRVVGQADDLRDRVLEVGLVGGLGVVEEPSRLLGERPLYAPLSAVRV